MAFVNPYAFVRLGDVSTEAAQGAHSLRRCPAYGHAELAQDRFSGEIQLSLSVRSPLLLGGAVRGATGMDLPRNAAGQVVIAGASLAGVVRNVHEAMNGSCLRVVDLDFVPVHRHPVTPKELGQLHMAVVRRRSPEGLPVEVELCDDVVWVHADWLAGKGLSSGELITVPDGLAKLKLGRRVLASKSDVTALHGGPGGDWVIHITDSKARSGGNVYFAAGHVGGGQVLPVPEATRTDLALALEGADDLRPGAHEPVDVVCSITRSPGDWRPTVVEVGRRRRVTAVLEVGQPVWVRRVTNAAGAQEVSQVRLSVAWRYVGGGTVGERIAEHHRPCTGDPFDDSRGLCPSCRVFGSAGYDVPDIDGPTTQNSYAGHVRFDELTADTPPRTQVVTRAPLSSPRPSAGQFYLTSGKHAGTASRDLPLAHWGSTADKDVDATNTEITKVRPIAGRKFYWRTDPTSADGTLRGAGQTRGRARGDDAETQTEEVTIIRPGASFTGRVTFDGLPLEAVGSLVAAIAPHLLWEGEDLVVSVGGGKPFGWGACRASTLALRCTSSAGRYLGTVDGPGEPTLADAVTAYRDACQHGTSWGADTSTWDDLRAVLTWARFPDADVAYPAGLGAPQDAGFDFWKNTSGLNVGPQPRPLGSLPPPAAPTGQHYLRGPG